LKSEKVESIHKSNAIKKHPRQREHKTIGRFEKIFNDELRKLDEEAKRSK
jgi:hypothetical protein